MKKHTKTKRSIIALILAAVTVLVTIPFTSAVASAETPDIPDYSEGIFGNAYTQRIYELAGLFSADGKKVEKDIYDWVCSSAHDGDTLMSLSGAIVDLDSGHTSAVLLVLATEDYMTYPSPRVKETARQQAEYEADSSATEEIIAASAAIYEKAINIDKYTQVCQSDVFFKAYSLFTQLFQDLAENYNEDNLKNTVSDKILKTIQEISLIEGTEDEDWSLSSLRGHLKEAARNAEDDIELHGNFDTLVYYFENQDTAFMSLGYDHEQTEQIVKDALNFMNDCATSSAMFMNEYYDIEDKLSQTGSSAMSDEELADFASKKIAQYYVFGSIICGAYIVTSDKISSFIADRVYDGCPQDATELRKGLLNSDVLFKRKAIIIEALSTGNLMTVLTTVMSITPTLSDEFIYCLGGGDMSGLFAAIYDAFNSFGIYDATGDEHGTVSCVEDAYAGQRVSVEVTPDAGYVLDTFEVYKTTDSSVAVETEGTNFVMPGYSVTVKATFRQAPSASKILSLSGDMIFYYNELEYNAQGLLIMATAYCYNGEGYETDSATGYTYDSNGNKTSECKYVPSGSELIPTSRDRYIYNEKEQLSSSVYEEFNNSVWEPLTYANYEYDGNKVTEYSYSGPTVMRTEIYCNSRGQEVKVVYSNWYNDTWNETVHTSYTYSNDGFLLTKEDEYRKYVYTYDDNGLITSLVNYYNTGSDWIYQTGTYYSYEDGVLKEEISSSSSDLTKIIYEYNSLGQNKTGTYYTMDSRYGVYELEGTLVYVYPYEITTSSSVGGTVILSSGSLLNSEIEITAIPSSGYEVKNITVYETDSSAAVIEVSSGIFTMPDANVTVDVEFGKTWETLQREHLEELVARAEEVLSSATAEKAAAEDAKSSAVAAQKAAEAAKLDAEKAKQEAEAQTSAAEDAKSSAVAAQKAAEDAKAAAEKAKQEAEAQTSAAEDAKSSAVAAQKAAEEAKLDAEKAKQEAEAQTSAAEDAKSSAVAAQKAAEDAQKAAEDAKFAAEKAKQEAEAQTSAAEDAKSSAVAAQKAAEAAKAAAEKAKQEAETQTSAAEDAKSSAIAAQKAAEAAKSAAEKAKQEAEAQTSAAEDAKSSAVAAQKAAEYAKLAAESEKKAAEEAKSAAIAEKNAAVAEREAAEKAGTAAEAAQKAAETAKTAAESAKSAAETEKKAAEAAKIAAENEKKAAEAAKTAAVNAQKAAEAAKASAEAEKSAAIIAGTAAETARAAAAAEKLAAENAKAAAETAKTAAEAEKKAAETAKTAAEAAKAAAEAAKAAAEAEKVAAEAAKKAAEEAESSAVAAQAAAETAKAEVDAKYNDLLETEKAIENKMKEADTLLDEIKSDDDSVCPCRIYVIILIAVNVILLSALFIVCLRKKKVLG